MTKFKIGDRVREGDWTGTVRSVYDAMHPAYDQTITVRWDNGTLGVHTNRDVVPEEREAA